MTCSVDCSVGDSYILNYYGTVPAGDPSNFGNVKYTAHLEGMVQQGSIPQTAPIAHDDAAGVAGLGSVTIDLTDNVTDAYGNIEGIDFSTLEYTYTGTATLTYNGDGTFTYQDVDNTDKTDSFTYRVSDTSGQVSNTATVIVTVATAGTNLPPAASSFSARTTINTAVDIDVTLHATDPDGSLDYMLFASYSVTN